MNDFSGSSDFSDTDVCNAVVIYESITRAQASGTVCAGSQQSKTSHPHYWEERLPGMFVCEYGKSRTA